MRYKDMIDGARAKGIASEEHMYKSIDRIDKMLERMKTGHPEEYWRFMRKTHSDMYGHHYDEEFADWDVSQLRYTGRDGRQHTGEHWTRDETKAVTRNKAFAEGTTEDDIYVALNVTYADLCRMMNDDQIINVAYTFWFEDEDAPEGKIWRYMMAMTC